jgi:hypothetical protein
MRTASGSRTVPRRPATGRWDFVTFGAPQGYPESMAHRSLAASPFQAGESVDTATGFGDMLETAGTVARHDDPAAPKEPLTVSRLILVSDAIRWSYGPGVPKTMTCGCWPGCAAGLWR